MPLGDSGVLSYDQIRVAYDSLPVPDSAAGLAYSTVVLSNERIRLGRATEDYPVLILQGIDGMDRRPDRHYANVRLRHHRRLRLQQSADIQTYSVLECFARDAAVQDWFFRLLPTLCQELGEATDAVVLEQRVVWLSELFRSFDNGPLTELTGFWAELLLLSRAPDLHRAVVAWHAELNAVHDFTHEGSYVEVKATQGSHRRHDFSASQLQPADSVLVASMLLERVDQGPSLLALYDAIVTRLSNDQSAIDKVHRQVMACVGRRLAEADDTRFDVSAAVRSLRCYLAGSVPQVSAPFPPGVLSVRFVADLDSVEGEVSIDCSSTPLWRQLFPR